jgi:hypothetical protein
MAYEQILGKVSGYIMTLEDTELDRFYLIQYQGIQRPHSAAQVPRMPRSWKYR